MQDDDLGALCNALSSHIVMLYKIMIKAGLITEDEVRGIIHATTAPSTVAPEKLMAMRDHFASLLLRGFDRWLPNQPE
jgi:hypothetical protein